MMPPTLIQNQLRSIIRIPGVKYYVKYSQGQSPQSHIREYFYYIDHQGMLFLDDARIKNFTSCFKEKKFLTFFFNRLRQNDTDRYVKHFPYLSLCGRERNYVRCDDLPIVFTHVLETNKDNNNNNNNQQDMFSYGHAGESLVVPFQPNKLCMSVHTGRVYHPAPEIVGGIGLVRSQLAIEFSSSFKFDNGENSNPTHFTWKSNQYILNTEWFRDKILIK